MISALWIASTWPGSRLARKTRTSTSRCTGLRYSELTALQVRDITTTSARTVDGSRVHRGLLKVKRAWKRQKDNSFKEESLI